MGEDTNKKIKLDRIIDAAEREFADKGYEKASTAQICQNAGVSKGLLFHHFGTKKQLYLEVYERILSDFMKEIEALTFDDCETYLDNIVKTSNAKLDYFIKNPAVYDIFLETQYSPPNDLAEELREIFDKYVDMKKYYSEMTFGHHKLRAGVDPHKAWEILQVVITLVEKKLVNEVVINNKEKKPRVEKVLGLSDELFEYLDIIFNGIAENDAISKRRFKSENNNDCEGCNKAV